VIRQEKSTLASGGTTVINIQLNSVHTLDRQTDIHLLLHGKQYRKFVISLVKKLHWYPITHNKEKLLTIASPKNLNMATQQQSTVQLNITNLYHYQNHCYVENYKQFCVEERHAKRFKPKKNHKEVMSVKKDTVKHQVTLNS